jgi:hypothetical protein
MAEDPRDARTIRGIDWKTTFPFTVIFRSFRIAVHPSKMILALIALVLIWLGGTVMDRLTPAPYRAVPGELQLFSEAWNSRNPSQEFNRLCAERRTEVEETYKMFQQQIGKPDASLRDIEWWLTQQRNKEAQAAEDRYQAASKAAKTGVDRENARQDRDEAVAATYLRAANQFDAAKAINNVGLFRSFCDTDLGAMNDVLRGVRRWNWMNIAGVVPGLKTFFVIVPAWASRHWIFFLIFGLYFLVIWSVLGGAICRIAAVHVARDEKISIRQALRFSIAKFLSFFSAPLIPIIIILAVGIVVAIGGLITNIPFIGPIIVGALFFLALAAGFVMTLVLIGLAGGFNLMYPTIAVEGSDSFDAISRSFSYLYARPWRLLLYTTIGVIYGALTYIFIRYFLMILLMLTHYFAGRLVFYHADNYASLWNMLWPSPLSVGRLAYPVQTMSLSWGQLLGAWLIAFWVYVVVCTLGAFVISMYFSTNTIIYYLMRNEVDATELDDVYLEQSPEDVVESATVTTTATTVITGSAAATDVSGTPIAPVGTSAPPETAPPPAQSSEAPPP